MNQSIKSKLVGKGIEPFLADLLVAFGLKFPHEIKAASDADLKRAGLKKEDIDAVRKVFPKAG